MAFLHVEILIMLLFLLPLRFMLASSGYSMFFYDIISNFSCADLDTFCDYIRDIILKDLLNESGSISTFKFYRPCGFMLELMYIPTH